MGFFQGLSDVFGFGDGGAGDAANQIQAANAAAQKQLTTQFEATQGRLDPFQEAGLGGLAGQVQGSTAGGLDERLGQIFGSENFQNLVGERTRAVQNALSAGGFRRSGAGVQELANVPTELGFGIENLLAGRQQGLAGQGLTAGLNLGQFGQAFGRDISGITQATGQSEAESILGGRANQAAGISNIGGLISGISEGGGISNIFKGLF